MKDIKDKPLFVLSNKVIKGISRGRKLGFPTANIDYPKGNVFASDGVYIVTIVLEGKEYKGVANIGAPLTFFDNRPRIDIYFFDFSESIYGKLITVSFWKKIREMHRFHSEQELIWQIEDDI